MSGIVPRLLSLPTVLEKGLCITRKWQESAGGDIAHHSRTSGACAVTGGYQRATKKFGERQSRTKATVCSEPLTLISAVCDGVLW